MKSHIKYKSGYKYQLVENYRVRVSIFPRRDIKTEYIDLNKDGFLTIKKGYAWDGPSGPTFDTKSFMRGALVHDALYQLMRLELLNQTWRREVDRELRRICLEDGMMGIRAWWVYKAVRHGAGYAASPDSRKKIYTAP